MKPRPTVEIQAVVALAIAVAVIALAGPSGAIAVLVGFPLGLLVAGGLALRYHRLRSKRDVSAHRIARDAIMRRCLLGGLALPIPLAAAALLLGPLPWQPPLDDVPGHIAAAAAVAVMASMLMSSCVDWYLIRPFRDGVLCAPVCQMDEHDDETTLYYARAWIVHRATAELFGWGGSGVIAIIVLVAIQNATDDPTWSDIFTYLAPAGAVYLWVGGHLLTRLKPVVTYLQRPSPGLGRWARGTLGQPSEGIREIDGFVVDVAIDPGLQVVADSDRDGDRETAAVALAEAPLLSSARRRLCAESCEGWIPQCDRGLREAEALEADEAKPDEAAARGGRRASPA